MSIKNLLIRALQEYDPTIDVDSAEFEQRVLDPIIEYTGDDAVMTSTKDLLLDRLDETAPELDFSVFGDLVVKPLEIMTDPLLHQIRTTAQKRSLRNTTYLTDSDLKGFAENYLVTRYPGARAQGTVRVYFQIPLHVRVPRSELLSINYDGKEWLFRPTSTATFSADQVRANKEGNSFYIDLQLEAYEAGEEYNLPRGAATGLTGVDGMSRAYNSLPFVGGSSEDDPERTETRIKSAITFRGFSTKAAAEFHLPALGVDRSYIITGGAPLMLRDRIFWDGRSPAWVPGGLTYPFSSGSGSASLYTSLGFAFDIWCKPEDYSVRRTFDISQATSKGVEILAARDGSLSYNQQEGIFELKTVSPRFSEYEVLGIEDDEGTEFQGTARGLRPVQVGDLVEFEGQLRLDDARYTLFRVVNIDPADNGTRLELEYAESALTPPAQSETYPGKSFRVFRDLKPTGFLAPHLETPDFEGLRQVSSSLFNDQPLGFFQIPLTSPRTIENGEPVILSSGKPLLPIPGTEDEDTYAAVSAPIEDNLISDITDFPETVVERISTQALGDTKYFYPRYPLYSEIEGLTITEEQKYVLRVKTHHLGPQDFSFLGMQGAQEETVEYGAYQVDGLPELVLKAPAYGFTLPRRDSSDNLNIESFSISSQDPSATGTHYRVLPELNMTGVDDSLGHFVDGHELTFLAYIRRVGSSTILVLPVELVETQNEDPSLGTNKFRITLQEEELRYDATYELLGVYQGMTENMMREQGRGPEGTYEAIHYIEVQNPGTGYTVPSIPTGTKLKILSPYAFHCDGFELISPIPGVQFSTQERMTLLLGTKAIRGERIAGKTLTVHASPGGAIRRVQDTMTSAEDTEGPIVATGLARQMTPVYVTLSLTYESDLLGVEDAAQTVLTEILDKASDARIEVSDLTAALYRVGATYVVSGRIFSLTINHLRQYETRATYGAITRPEESEFVITAITCRKLKTRKRGQTLNELDETNIEAEYTARPGGFDED